MKFEPNQLVKCPYTSEPLKIVRVLTCEYEGWFNLYVVDANGAEDFVLHTPTNPVQIIKFKKVVTAYKGFKIHQVAEHTFNVYTADEWAYGEGFRQVEWEAGNLQEAKDFIDSY